MTATRAAFAPLLAADPAQPFVVAQLGQSLDGRIATQSGESRYISGPGALDHLHLLRAHVDGVIVGIGTVIADDPQLTVRRAPGRSPARIVLDPRGRMPAGARCLAADDAPVIVIRAQGQPACAGAATICLPADAHGHIAPRAIIDALFAQGLRRLLVEGGAATVSAFIDAGCADRLHLLVAPVLIGSGKPGLALNPVSSLANALWPQTSAHPLPGGDVLFDCDLRAPRAPLRGDMA